MWSGESQKVVTKVTKTHLKGRSGMKRSPSNLVKFDDSKIMMFPSILGRIKISLDSGHTWETIDEIEDNISSLHIDKFYGRDRAVAESDTGNLYITDDQGKHWRQMRLPLEAKREPFCYVSTHPYDRDLILVNCILLDRPLQERKMSHEKFPRRHSCEQVTYISKDGGRSFNRIFPPVDNIEGISDISRYGTTCYFAVSSRNSVFQKDLLYCIYTVERALDREKSNTEVKGSMFYSHDLGENLLSVEELENYSVSDDIDILSSHIVIATYDDAENVDAGQRIWASNGGTFEQIGNEIKTSCFDCQFEDDFGRLFIVVDIIKDQNCKSDRQLFVSQPQSLIFSPVDSLTPQPVSSVWLEKPHYLKRTMLALLTYDSQIQQGSESNKQESNPTKGVSDRKRVSKLSFDNGTTWSNLRVSRSSASEALSYGGDINNAKHSSLHILYLCDSSIVNDRFTSSSIMAVGMVGQYALLSEEEHAMTFISRNCGNTWELAFKNPTISTFADFGNIIVAIPEVSKGEKQPSPIFLFSLDQGKTWIQRRFEGPDSSHDFEFASGFNVEFLSTGRNVVIRFSCWESDIICQDVVYTIDFQF
ncbi:uncharacterized protein ZBAI_08089 [Zygosaccharomyces bailii ISA1307]|nr:uncharacterized protein ZBAI_08089 [Zygosaccharomyces bailii ISA1307]